MWLPVSTDESVESFGRLPGVAEADLTDAELRDAATRILQIGCLLHVYGGAWRGTEPGRTGIQPASEFSAPIPPEQAPPNGPVPLPSDALGDPWCGTR